MSRKNERWTVTTGVILAEKSARENEQKPNKKRAQARRNVDEYLTEKKLKQEFYYL